MRKFLRIGMTGGFRTIASVLIFIACANPAFSQSAVQAEQGLEQVQAPAQPAPAMKSQKFGDWYYRCTGSAGTEACEVAQVAQVTKDGKPVNILTLAIAASPAPSQGKGDKGKPRLMLTALLPLNVFLPSGLSIKADGKPVAKLEYRNCNQSGCWAQQALDTKTAAALKKGSSAEGLVRLMNGQAVNIRFSLKGLKPALDELQPTAVK
ncbi:invasion associated locus B family protein (plasmid) [Rhizobium leguminosarum]|uniref:invasion associated locus B family protein n=1 Tax=Rhizobium leguminosarum TaxID=384 RepID=UPI0014411CC4|nr:invasion associated locus B family protein [Rhizobium leguminosarum]MBY5815920.1 invasion associated locus B family protein [Rhizobium leguminosarum]MBY5835539.1 invasion associated locus B family protein [Rhizobium leguminosarum]NKL74984.1 invasion associated locus B family protein [Rhizobium leguminosarum bv. viciae]NKM78176.1 invasion associated locus B family protein [Rhizobium leguminosarum bv. viciae]QSZ11619.1 invasion associated locus B family protein [Rhizobium leguminosarum]